MSPRPPPRTLCRWERPAHRTTVWGTIRAKRHTETGWLITALSTLDLALWDLHGKAAGQPVWRLLGPAAGA